MNIDHRPRQPKWSTDLCQCGEDPSTCECSLSVTQTQINTPFKNCENLAIDVHRSCGAGLITCCLPCITFGRIAEVLDEGQSSCVAEGCVYGLLMLIQCHWILSCVYREKLRSKFGLPEDPCSDCCVHCCCEPCALCQEHAELKHRGLNPSKGWIGPPTAPPQLPPSMYR
ncbi:cell number regulator 10-like isoform X2 [Alnus glutinosa]|uniref:cell number regulator 10-like isoform X2 n=1 Tax=Alnus glutinosa TaxID=3517 RepID=UPI002D783CB2|nr:cell number regulator 10-like isoform X2 [Alnus glutinosa]